MVERLAPSRSRGVYADGGAPWREALKRAELLPLVGLPLLLALLLLLAAFTRGFTYLQGTRFAAAVTFPSAEGSSGGSDSNGGGGFGECATFNSTCGQLLGVKKVALLFLTTTDMPHEATWRLWLEGAAGMVPRQHLLAAQQAACGSDTDALRRLACVCAPQRRRRRRLRQLQQQQQQQQQPWRDLFSVYVHPAPWPQFKFWEAPGFEEGSVFRDAIIQDRLATGWGELSLVLAHRRLLEEALKDPLNDRFVLISNSGLPLYDPLTFYQRLMSADKSLVQACWAGNRPALPMWRKQMETPLLKSWHVRKSSQFVSLIRRHAELVAADQEVLNAFKAHCSSAIACRAGTPDELYVGTLLAAHNASTHCMSICYTEWHWPPQAHPKSFGPADVNPQRFHNMRGPCDNSSEIQAAQRMFVPLDEILAEGGVGGTGGSGPTGEACQALQAAAAEESLSAAEGEPPIRGDCLLTARKFPASCAAAARDLFVSTCQPGSDLQLLTGRGCSLARQQGLLPAADGKHT